MRRFQSVGDLAGDFERFLYRNWPLRDAFRQCGAVNQFHHIVIWADVVYRADVRMAQGSHCAHFTIEALAELFMGNL
jgi:hypothetical protein